MNKFFVQVRYRGRANRRAEKTLRELLGAPLSAVSVAGVTKSRLGQKRELTYGFQTPIRAGLGLSSILALEEPLPCLDLKAGYLVLV